MLKSEHFIHYRQTTRETHRSHLSLFWQIDESLQTLKAFSKWKCRTFPSSFQGNLNMNGELPAFNSYKTSELWCFLFSHFWFLTYSFFSLHHIACSPAIRFPCEQSVAPCTDLIWDFRTRRIKQKKCVWILNTFSLRVPVTLYFYFQGCLLFSFFALLSPFDTKRWYQFFSPHRKQITCNNPSFLERTSSSPAEPRDQSLNAYIELKEKKIRIVLLYSWFIKGCWWSDLCKDTEEGAAEG